MKTGRIFSILFVVALSCLLAVPQSCNKKGTPNPVYLTVSIPDLVMQNGLYYSLDYRERSVELDFSAPPDSSTIKGNISFSDKSGALDSLCNLSYTAKSFHRL